MTSQENGYGTQSFGPKEEPEALGVKIWPEIGGKPLDFYCTL